MIYSSRLNKIPVLLYKEKIIMGKIMFNDIEYAGGGGGGASSESIAPIEETSTASQAYSIGDLLFYDDTLYRVTSAISLGGTIITSGASANVTETDIDTELKTKAASSHTHTKNQITDFPTIPSVSATPISGGTDAFSTGGAYTELAKKQDIIQYSTLPTPSAEYFGKLVQYTGYEDGLVHGYFYTCMSDAMGEEYYWEYTPVSEDTTKANKVDGATFGDLAGLDSNGDLTDSGINKNIFPSGASSSNKLITANDIADKANKV